MTTIRTGARFWKIDVFGGEIQGTKIVLKIVVMTTPGHCGPKEMKPEQAM